VREDVHEVEGWNGKLRWSARCVEEMVEEEEEDEEEGKQGNT